MASEPAKHRRFALAAPWNVTLSGRSSRRRNAAVTIADSGHRAGMVE
jgi:hypothetical protein